MHENEPDNSIVNYQLLSFDALYEAEKITGKSYKEDESTSKLGMVLNFVHSQKKQKLLVESCDSYYNQTLDNYLKILDELGFKQVVKMGFIDKQREGSKDEIFFIYYHPDGILLRCDTWRGHVNGCDFYYNWKPLAFDDEFYRKSSMARSNGCGFFPDKKNKPKEYIWIGHHDGREAIKFNIEQLRKYGTFVVPWVQAPFLWLLHYGDTKDEKYDYEEINKTRLAMLPKDVRELFGI